MQLRPVHVCAFAVLSVGCLGITLNNGAYEDLYVVIQDTVPENEAIITRIKEIFTSASSSLFIATDQRVHFGKIKIIVPKSWTPRENYTSIPELSPLESYIHVDNGAVRVPHVRRDKGGCGNPGKYMYLHTDFIQETGLTDWGPHTNVLLHEWGHLRWGLYEEYPLRRHSNFYQEGGQWKPIKCTDTIEGTVSLGDSCSPPTPSEQCDVMDTGNKIKDACRFCPDTKKFASASLMGFQFIERIWTFCDEDSDATPASRRHNSRTSSEQNLYCDRKSSWEVMRAHPDFATDTQLLATTVVDPVFEVLQDTVKYQAFVLDVSLSMRKNKRFENMFSTCQYMINSVLKTKSWLAIVTFALADKVEVGLTEINGQADRDTLKAALPTEMELWTCIGCGTDRAIELFKEKLGDPAGSTIYLLSDGRDNRGDLDQSIQNAVNNKVVVHSIAISDDADPRLEDIAKRTGGKYFSYLEVRNGSSSLAASFAAAISGSATGFNSEPITITSEVLRPGNDGSVNFTFSIEDGLGNDTSLSFMALDAVDMTAAVVTPDGTRIENSVTASNVMFVNIPGIAPTGEYDVSVTLSADPQKLEYFVTSYPTSGHALKVISRVSASSMDFAATSDLPKVLADVVKGGAPVLNVTVTAQVQTGSGYCNVDLKDNGVDPDEVPDDGTYMGYIPHSCLDNGRINVKVYADGAAGESSLLMNPRGAFTLDASPDETETVNSTFQRISLAEVFTVQGYTPSTADITPPSRITNVDVIDVVSQRSSSGESRNFSVTWTAPGDDYSLGQATEYEFRVSDDINLLVNDFSTANLLELPNANFTPSTSGQQETLTLVIDAENAFTNTTFFAVVAKDEAGNVGRVSNPVSIVVATGYRITTAEYSPRVIEEMDTGGSRSSQQAVLIAVAAMFAVFLLLLAGVVVMRLCLWRRNSKDGKRRRKSRFQFCWPLKAKSKSNRSHIKNNTDLQKYPHGRSRHTAA